MSAVLRVILFVPDPLGKLGADFAETAKVGVELESDDALILPVVVTEDIPPVRQRQRVNGPAVIEVEPHANEQLGDGIDDVLDRESLCAAPQGTVAALDQRRAVAPSHEPLTLPAESPPAA